MRQDPIAFSEVGEDIQILWEGVAVGRLCGRPDAEDRLEPMGDGLILWTRTTVQPTDHMVLRFITCEQPAYIMVPGLNYNGNEFGDRLDYVGITDHKTGLPWRYAWHRETVAGATWSEGVRFGCGMYLPEDQHDASCSVYPSEEGTVHELLWPEQEGPRVYRQKHEWIDGYEIPGQQKHRFAAYLVITPLTRPRAGWHALMDAAWRTERKVIRRWYDDERLRELGIRYAHSLIDHEPDGFIGFSIGNQWEDGAYRHRQTQKYEIGWCGQNASLAVSLLAESQRTGDMRHAQAALEVLDAWVRATRPNGLIPTHYDDNMYTQGFAKTVDACNLGTAALQFFEAYDRCRALGIDRRSYEDTALAICDFAVRVMREDGAIGKSWLEKDLSPAVTEGTVGAFLTMALSAAAARYPEGPYRQAAERSMLYYIGELRQNGYTTAGALDIYCVDKESSIPLLKSALMLHQLTGEARYLEMAVDAAYYLSTWQVHFTKSYPPQSPLGQMGFDTFGGTVVSTTHLSIDHFALCYVNDLIRLSSLTGDPVWKERAEAIWLNGQQGVSDGTLTVEGRLRPAGSQDEGLQYTYWSELDCPTRWLVAWPGAFRLEQLRNR